MTKYAGNSPFKCINTTRAIPYQHYALPDDGKKKTHLCLLRHAVANYLATFAPKIWPGKKKIAAEIGIDIRTVGRVLADLETLGILTADEIHGYTRTRMRSLHPEKLLCESDTPESLCESDTPTRESDTPPPRSDTPRKAPKGSTYKEPLPPQNENRGGDLTELLTNVPEQMLAPALRKSEKEQVQKLIAEHGCDKLTLAIQHYVKAQPDLSYFERTRLKWQNFIEAASVWLQQITPAEIEAFQHEQWLKVPANKEADERRIQQSIDAQTEEITKRLSYTPAVSEVSLEDFMA